MDEIDDQSAGRSRAGLGLGALTAALLLEGRFRALQAETLARIDPASAEGVSGGRDAVAAWHVAGGLADPWIHALVVGGLVAGIAVTVRRQSARRRTVWTLVCAALVCFALLGVGTTRAGAQWFEPTNAAYSRWLQPGAVAGVSLVVALLLVWVAGPLAARVARTRAAWVALVLALGAMLSHAAASFRRGEPPLHDVRTVDSWFVSEPGALEANGTVQVHEFGSVHLDARARLASDAVREDDFHAWIASGAQVRELDALGKLSANDGEALELIDAAWITRDRQPSTRPTPDAPSLITIAVDGLRPRDLAERLQARSAPPAIQRCAEAGVFFPTVVAPTSDPRANEAALLMGEHPGARGRAPIAQHLGTALNASGLLVTQLCEGAPRPGVAGGFARVDARLGANVIPAARRFLAAHAEERFLLHVTLERLALSETWDADLRSVRKPEGGERLQQLRELADVRVAERATRAERSTDASEPIDVEWRAWLDAAHAARTRELLLELDEFFADVESHGLADRCIVVLVGTGGIALGEHDRLGFGQDLHAESVQVPLLARGPDLPVGERRDGLRDMTLIAGALARSCQVAWPGREASWDWTARDAQPRPIFLRATHGSWNGTPDREILGLVAQGHVLLWCPAAELDTGLLPGFGSWRMYRMEDDPAETTDLSLVNEFVETSIELRAELRVRAEAFARERARAESQLEPWASIGAWSPEVNAW
ncbi:MAG: hypothetical protein KDC14_04475 [Planctomycetes bacterium]|nr:hypothetical protein [Planctomycetota bacterium]